MRDVQIHGHRRGCMVGGVGGVVVAQAAGVAQDGGRPWRAREPPRDPRDPRVIQRDFPLDQAAVHKPREHPLPPSAPKSHPNPPTALKTTTSQHSKKRRKKYTAVRRTHFETPRTSSPHPGKKFTNDLSLYRAPTLGKFFSEQLIPTSRIFADNAEFRG